MKERCETCKYGKLRDTEKHCYRIWRKIKVRGIGTHNCCMWYRPRWYKTKTFGRILVVVVIIAWIEISSWLAYFKEW